MNAISIVGLEKSFGPRKVLDGLDLVVPEGSLFGFVGLNGAGKTTTMKILLGLIPGDGGQAAIYDTPVKFGDTRINRQVGYLCDVPEFYNFYRPAEYLRLCGEISGMSSARIAERVPVVLRQVGLEGDDRKIGGFSRGMKQRLGLAQALVHEPKLLICDEPTSALDPLGRGQLLDLLVDIRKTTTVLFSTHILSDVTRVCDRVAVLHGGKIVLAGSVDDIQKNAGQSGVCVTLAAREGAVALAQAFDTKSDGCRVTVEESRKRELLHALWQGEYDFVSIAPREARVEELLVEAIR